MTGIALICSQRMRWRFACGYAAIVAVATHISGLAMIERRYQRRPWLTGCVTSITGIRGQRMISAFSGSYRTVVTAATHIGGLAMVKRQQHRHPSVTVMTSIALLTG